jgi:outer membrane lipoprotein SlyB
MFIRRTKTTAAAVIASVSAIALLGASAAPAQEYYQDQGPPQYRDVAPPAGEYAPPPGDSYSRSYDARVRDYDRDYAQQYSGWAAQNCVDRRNTNTVAGAVIGGVLGAVIGSNVAGHGERTGGAIVGGALGATAGGVIGNASTEQAGCPPGYVTRSGAPEFYYSGAYDGPRYSAPSWYRPWYWTGNQWVYRPYRAWYYEHPTYWRSDYAQQSDQGYYDQAPPSGYDRSYAPPPGYDRDYGPPAGQYAPPPPEAGPSYSYRYQQYDRDYASRYSSWAAENCVDRRNNNTAAGAIIGGVLGAVIGSGVAGHHERGEGAVVGGVLGAGAGAAIGASSGDTRGCPPGYVVRAGAPAFYYGGGYGSAYWGPSWYHPWTWYGGHWVYRPYRQWYYGHPMYWRHRRY